jgi:transposase
MLVVETIGKIRRAYFVHGKPIKAICRDLKVSRKVVRKVLRSGATSFEYEREVQPLPKIGPWKADLERILEGNAAKPARERLTLMRVFEELRGLGYQGGYDAVRRYARSWHREQAASSAAAFVPLSFAPGEAYQFDWSHEVVLINGTTVIVKVAHVRLCHSRMMFVRAYPRETQEMVFDAHDRAFAFFKGACTRQSTTRGTMCQSWPASRARSGTARHSRTGSCRPAWIGCAASWRAPTMATGRW